MTQSDIEKMIEDMEATVVDLAESTESTDDDYSDLQDLLVTAIEQLTVIYLD